MQRLFAILTLFGCLDGQGQEAVTQGLLYDEYFAQVKSRSAATFHGAAEKDGEKYLIKLYWLSTNKLAFEGSCVRIAPSLRLAMHTVTTSYNENGVPTHAVLLRKGHDSTSLYRRICQVWNKAGEPQLINGTGVLAEKDEKLRLFMFREFKDSIGILAYHVSLTKGDTIYTEMDKPLSYIGGFAALKKEIDLNTSCPPTVLKNELDSKVVVIFRLDKQGKKHDIGISEGGNLGTLCESEAIRVVKSTKGWIPGSHNGRPVDVQVEVEVPFPPSGVYTYKRNRKTKVTLTVDR